MSWEFVNYAVLFNHISPAKLTEENSYDMIRTGTCMPFGHEPQNAFFYNTRIIMEVTVTKRFLWILAVLLVCICLPAWAEETGEGPIPSAVSEESAASVPENDAQDASPEEDVFEVVEESKEEAPEGVAGLRKRSLRRANLRRKRPRRTNPKPSPRRKRPFRPTPTTTRRMRCRRVKRHINP